MKKVLVIAAHPDDELLGCGATVALHTSRGDIVKSLVVCEGESMRGQEGNKKSVAVDQAAQILGVKEVILKGLPDQHLDTLSLVDVITPIEEVVNSFEPNIVYCQFGGDINRDHQIVFAAALVALRPKNEFVEEIYSFYTASSTEWNYPMSFIPDTWVGFNEGVMQQKIDAFKCYESEICEYPHPRSPEAIVNLARTMGNQCCMEYAETFKTIRKIKRP